MRVYLIIIIVVVFLTIDQTIARSANYRVKRVTDNHLADLETKIALNNKLKGIVVTMPVGGGRIDPLRIGRKRRSESRMLDILFNQSEEDRGDPIDYVNDNDSNEDDDNFLNRFQLK